MGRDIPRGSTKDQRTDVAQQLDPAAASTSAEERRRVTGALARQRGGSGEVKGYEHSLLEGRTTPVPMKGLDAQNARYLRRSGNVGLRPGSRRSADKEGRSGLVIDCMSVSSRCPHSAEYASGCGDPPARLPGGRGRPLHRRGRLDRPWRTLAPYT